MGSAGASAPAFLAVQYYDPFAPLPPGQTQAGIQAFLTNAPANTVAFARLLANNVPTWSARGDSASTVTVLNDVPLVPDVSYQLQVAFAPQAGSPNWSGPGVLRAPVLVQSVQLTSLTVGASGNAVRITWDWASTGGASISAVALQLVLGSNVVGSFLSAGSPTVLDLQLDPGDYQVVLSAAQPIAASGGGASGGPYTLGPSTLPQWIPTKAPAIVSVTCADGTAAVRWTAPVTAAASAAPGWDLLLLDGTSIVASASAGQSGGQISLAGVETLKAPQVAARMRFGPFAGPAGASAPLYPLAPTIPLVQVSRNGANATILVQVSSPGALPAGAALMATLYTNGFAAPSQAVSTTNWTTSFALNPAKAGTAYEVDAQMVVTAAGQTSSGPRTPRIAVPVALPQVTAAGYDGRNVTIDLSFDTPVAVDGYDVTLSGPTQLKLRAGSALPIVFPASLDLASAYQVSVTPLAGVLRAASTASASVTMAAMAAPAVTALDYDGEWLVVRWSAAVLPFLSGYRIRVTGSPGVIAAAGESSCAIPLAPAKASGASVTVTALSPLRETPPSAAVAIVSSLTPIGSLSVDPATGQAKAGWIKAAGATGYRLRLTQDGAATEITVDGTATSYGFTPAPGAAAALSLAAVDASGGARVTGPFGPAAPMPSVAPVLISTAFDGTTASLAWTPAAGATGYRATILRQGAAAPELQPPPFPAAATQAQFTFAPSKADGSYSAVIQALFGAFDGPASAAAPILVSSPTFTPPAFDGRTLTTTLTPPAGPAPAAYAVTLLRDGTEIQNSTQIVLGGKIEMAVVEPADPAAAYRLAIRPVLGPALGPGAGAVAALASPPVAAITWGPTVDVAVLLASGWTGSARLLVDGAAQAPVALDPKGKASLPVPSKGAVALSIQGTLSGATGPWSTPFALPDAVPPGLGLQLDGGQLAAAWSAVQGADGYRVTLVTDKGNTSERVLEPRSVLTLPAGATTASVAVAAIFGLATGRSSPPVAALFAGPTLNGAAYDGATLSLDWQAIGAASGYSVAAMAGGSVLAQAEFTTTPAALPLAPGAWDIVVRALAGGAASPPSLALTPITEAPLVASIAFDPASGDCTVTWLAVAGAGGYVVTLTAPGQSTFEDNTTAIYYTIPAAQLAGGVGWSFACQGVEGSIVGPLSQPVALPNLAPSLPEISFDGTTIRASWPPTGGAEGYRLSLLSSGSATALADVGGPNAAIAPGSAPAADAALLVQAITALGTGPASAPAPLSSLGWFVAGAAPYGLAPLTAPAAQPADLVLSLPDLFGGATPTLPPASATFKLQPSAPGYSLTILAGSPAWKWDDPSRGAVRSDYATLLQALEQAHWTPPARALVLEAIARALPQRFDETGFFACGFQPGQGWFDLRPGMVLHVEYEGYQYIGPTVDPSQASFLDGFTAAAAADYPVTGAWDGTKWFVTLDSALAAMAVGNPPGIRVPTVAPQGDFSAGGGGLIDAFFDLFRQPLCRIVYPKTLLDASSPGDARLAANPVLLAASTLADLSLAARAVRDQAALPASVGAFYFRGRATLSPRIQVSIDGRPLLVAVGTTVGDVLAGDGARGAGPVPGLRVGRGTGPAALLPNRPASLDVRLDWTSGGSADWLDLPLMAGDRIETAR